MSRGLRYLRSNALGALALFVALGGTSYAASGGFTAASSSIKACAGGNGVLKLQTGKKCKKGQKAVSWNQQGVPGPTGPSGIAGLNGAAVPNATKAVDATTATTAQTANNALALGGIPASGFTQRGCAADTGQVKGFAQIPANISTAFQSIGTVYNCSGGAVEARQIIPGAYRFKFANNPAEIALATVIDESESFATANVVRFNTTEWGVTVSENGKFAGHGVSLVLF